MTASTSVRLRLIVSMVALVIVAASVSSVITWSLVRHSGVGASDRTVRPCSGNALDASEQHQGAGGSMYVFVIFLNTSSTGCSLAGYPTVTLYNATGTAMAHEPQRDSPWTTPRRVVVASGGVAGFVMQFGDGAVSGVDPPQGCRAASSMEVTLPHVLQDGLVYRASLTMPLAPCDGGGFEVTAMQGGEPMP
jgi:hypothetical protein